jgi:hypothetical protein
MTFDAGTTINAPVDGHGQRDFTPQRTIAPAWTCSNPNCRYVERVEI